MKNTLPDASVVRTPRGAVKIGGKALQGWVEFDTSENEFAQPDSFSVLLAMADLPDDMNAAFFAKAEKLEIELYAGFPADPESYTDADLDLIFSGKVDDVGLNWTNRSISLTGRDLTAKLMEQKSPEKYPNLTASAIAEKIAAAAGLTPKVTKTTEKVGKYYQIDNVDQKTDQTDWDLLTWLAREEGFMVFVRGKELHFREKPEATQDPYVIEFKAASDGVGYDDASVTDIRCGRSLTAAGGIRVEVMSWSPKTKKRIKKTATRQGGAGSEPQVYRYTIANLTADQAEARAKQILTELSRHAMTLDITGPADNVLRIDDVIELRGTGSDCDQVYYPQSIDRSLRFDGGYDWNVRAKNQSPESEGA